MDNDIGGNTPDAATPGRGNSAGAAIGQKNCRDTAGASSCTAAADHPTAGIGALRKHVDARGRVHWFLTVAGIEVEMTSAQLLSARRAERKIIEALIALDIYDLPESLTQREWHRLVVDRLKHLGTPCGRARTIDGAYRFPWWRRPLLACRRLLRAA